MKYWLLSDNHFNHTKTEQELKLTTAFSAGLLIMGLLWWGLSPEPKAVSSSLPEVATISCPFGNSFTISRGSDATVTVTCVKK